MNEYSYKNRNTLTLSQRVQVIREYDLQTPKPKIQWLANKYNVSFPQIKSILYNRKSILTSYQEAGGDNIHEELHGEFLRKRQEKIDFLGDVMYEYVQRIMHLNLSIDDEQVLQKAIEVKECIAVVNFRPTLKWLNDFKSTYGIPSFDLETLRNNITLTEPKRSLLTVFDLIAHVSRLEKKLDNGNHVIGNKTKRGFSATTPPPLLYNDNKEPKIVYETISDEDIEVQTATGYMPCNPQHSHINDDTRQQTKSNKRRCTNDSLCEIESLEEALKHLRLLEEYAMLQDNFRAIGLLTQLEQVFKKSQKM